jgi:hypothetical protein
MSSTSENPFFSIDLFDSSSSPSSHHSFNVLSGSIGPHFRSSPSPQNVSRLAVADYSNWRENWWPKFPDYCLAEDSLRQRSWWWPYGYRLKKADSESSPAYLWVCATCVSKLRPQKRSKYTFIASTGKSIEAHLRTIYRLIKRP